MLRRFDQLLALFDPARGGPRFAGFMLGAILPLALVAIVTVVYNGGLSDTPGTRAPVYVIE